MSRILWIALILGAPLLAEPAKHQAYENWLNTPDTWIRVGLQKPDRQLTLYAKGELLVLDDRKVVGSINPNGRFVLIQAKGIQRLGGFFVQVKASQRLSFLADEKLKLETAHPDWNYEVHPSGRTLKGLRIGPYGSRDEALSVRDTVISEGYDDAFLVRGKAPTTFQWVDGDFDKFDLKSHNLGLVKPDPNHAITYDGVSYRGILRFRKEGNKIRVINELPLEVYLRGVVPSELGPHAFPELEALKAQAVAARTYALKNMGRFNRKGYDICDGPACQAYDGTKNEHPLSDQAVAETAGLVLYYGDTLIDALYTSTCGGQTDDVGNVFPGRDEPYLRSKSSYLANFKSWTLPRKDVPRARIDEAHKALAVQALMYGFTDIPDFRGDMSNADLTAALQNLSWIFGTPPKVTGTLTRAEFWRTLSQLDFFKQAVSHQMRADDVERLVREHQLPPDLEPFAAILLRHHIIHLGLLDMFSDTQPITRVRAYQLLLDLAAKLGPEPEWRRYRLEKVDGAVMTLSRNLKNETLNLDDIRWYISMIGDVADFREEPRLEELDRIYRLKAPFPDNILRVREAGGVSSVDRFSAYDFWMEKKSVEDLESRARRYIKGLRGLRDVKVLSRSETGRVTRLRFIADSGIHEVDGLRIRWSLGVRDNLIDLLPNYRNGRLVHLTVVGRGWGHGVGMSQVGAFGLARMGWTFERILTHYYTDVQIRAYTPKTTQQPG